MVERFPWPDLPIFCPKPKFSLASERRKPEEEGEDDTSIPVSKTKNCQHWQKSLCSCLFSPSKHLYLCVSSSFPFSYIYTDLLRKHVTFPIRGNLMGIASKWKISNCLTVIPRLHPSLQRQMDLFPSRCRNILLQFLIARLCSISNWSLKARNFIALLRNP